MTSGICQSVFKEEASVAVRYRKKSEVEQTIMQVRTWQDINESAAAMRSTVTGHWGVGKTASLVLSLKLFAGPFHSHTGLAGAMCAMCLRKVAGREWA